MKEETSIVQLSRFFYLLNMREDSEVSYGQSRNDLDANKKSCNVCTVRYYCDALDVQLPANIRRVVVRNTLHNSVWHSLV
jgi:hypothetical protein